MRLPWLFLNLLSREVRNRYVGSVSGVLWVFLQPLVLLGIYAFVFATIFKVRLPGLGDHGYVTFVALALWPWLAFQEAVQRGSGAILANAALIGKAAFPREMVVYGAAGASLLVHLAGYVLILLVIHLFATPLQLAGLPLLLPLLAVLALLGLGLALILAALTVLFRDVEQALGPIFMVWFYASPILYPLSLVPEHLRWLFHANPLTYVAERARALLIDGRWQPDLADGLALAGSIVFFLAGLWFFRRVAPHLEDFL